MKYRENLAKFVNKTWLPVKMILLFIILSISRIVFVISPTVGILIFLVFLFSCFVVIVDAVFY